MSTKKPTADDLSTIGQEARNKFSPALLQNKVALVTGASRGIGRAIAIGLGAIGAEVIINYHSDEKAAAQVVAAIKDLGGHALAKRFNVQSVADTRIAVEDILEQFENIDILVNNAGIGEMSSILEITEDKLDEILSINLKGALFCCQCVVPSMIQTGGGKIVNVSSLAAFIGMPLQSAYAASKAAIIGMTHSMAKELAPHSIQVNVVAPGFILTDMTAGVPDEIKDQVVAGIPAARAGDPKDVAWATLFLSSSMSNYITGETLMVDGGVATR